MNVIENILTTKPYMKVKKVSDIRKVLAELQNIELDFSDKNIVYTYNKMIVDALKEIIKDVPYELDYNLARDGILIQDSARWERILNTEPLTTVPTSRSRAGSISIPNHRHDGWNFGVDNSNRFDTTTLTTIDGATISHGVIAPTSRSNNTISTDSLNPDILATFNGIEIGNLEAVEYTSSRSNAEQN